jgi:hypothetical protein
MPADDLAEGIGIALAMSVQEEPVRDLGQVVHEPPADVSVVGKAGGEATLSG